VCHHDDSRPRNDGPGRQWVLQVLTEVRDWIYSVLLH
jgi:hypothetical protein